MSKGGNVMRFEVLATVLLGIATSIPLYAKDLQGPEVAQKVDDIRRLNLPTVTGDYIVAGDQMYDGWFLKAERIIFKPSAKLIFSRTALGNRRHFYIVAKEIVMEDSGAPGTITWERAGTPNAPGSGGQAGTGGHANSEGARGGTGQTGGQGPEGSPGESAPSITMYVLKVPGSGPTIDLSGQTGGPGGVGQQGGDGGVGGWGNPASQNCCNCNRGAGNGAQGGDGGVGGTGGIGGRGGNGGVFTLISDASALGALTQRFRVNTTAGDGGAGGPGGKGGNGGPGGRGGQEALPWCRGNGSTGPNGGPGGQGGSGSTGPKGVNGDLLVGGTGARDFEITYTGGS